MHYARIACSVVLGLVMATATASGQEVELKNDGFSAGQAAGFQAGFAAGEIGAVRLDPTGTGPFRITKVQFLFGGASTTQTITLRIYQDTGGTNPGTELYFGDYQVTGNDQALHEIDLSAQNVLVPASFRVGIEFQHSGAPAIARDNDGNIKATYNFIYTSSLGWVQSNLFGLTGDWVIRAFVIDTGVGAVDAGPGGPDASMPVDAGPGAPDAGGSVVDAGADAPDAAPGGPDAGADTCMLNSDCLNGQYCGDNNVCTFDCRVATDCNAGELCDGVGRCVPEEESDSGCCSGSDTPGKGNLLLILLLGAWFGMHRWRALRG